jgi:hypothetical protein
MSTRNPVLAIATVPLLILGLAIGASTRAAVTEQPAAAATRPAKVVPLKLDAVGLSMKHPERWKSQPIKSGPDDPEAERLSGVRFAIDDVQTIVALLRFEAALPAGTDAAAFARQEIARHHAASVANGAKILEDRDLKVGDSTGRLVEIQVDVDDQPMRVMTAVFVVKGHQYKIGFIGEKNFYGDARAAVLEWIGSFEAIN